MSDIEERLDRLESLVDQQQERIDQQQETIREQRDRIRELETEPNENVEDGSTTLDRRDALKAGGLLALLFGGVGTASADAQGQVGTSSDPLQALYTAELNGSITDGGGGPQPLTKLPGDGLAIDGEELIIDPGDGLGIDGETVAVDIASGLGFDGNGSLQIPSNAIGNDELENDTVSVGPGEGLSGGGNLSLGGATTLDVDPSDFAGRNLTASGGDLDYVRPENVVVVAKSGGDYTTVSSALASISDNAADNPYVIRIAPGVYNEKIQLKSYVDIVGSGIHATRIESTQGSRDNATLQGNGATNVEVRQITVQGDSALISDYETDISVVQSRIRSADPNSRAVSQYGGTVRLQNCLVEATGNAAAGIMVAGGTIDVSHCRVEGQVESIYKHGRTANVRHSQLVGSSYAVGGSPINTFSVCDGSYNGI